MCIYLVINLCVFASFASWLLFISLINLSPSNSSVLSSPPSHHFPIFVHLSIVSSVTCPSFPRSLVVQTTKVHIWAVQPTRSSPLTERHHHSHLYPLIWKPHSILVRTWWLWYSLVKWILILMSLFSCSCPCALSELSELQKWRKYILATKEFTTQKIIKS